MMRKEGIRSENSNQAICWATHKEAVSQQVTRSVSGNIRPHRDPTADAAIGNVMREEKLRKAKQRKQKCRKAKQHGAHQANKQRRDCIQCGKGGQRDVKE